MTDFAIEKKVKCPSLPSIQIGGILQIRIKTQRKRKENIMKKLDFMFRIFIVLLFTLILFSCEKNVTRPTDPAVVPAGMVFVPGGNFLMGSAEVSREV